MILVTNPSADGHDDAGQQEVVHVAAESRAQPPEREHRDPDAQQIQQRYRHHEVGRAGQKNADADGHAIEPAPPGRRQGAQRHADSNARTNPMALSTTETGRRCLISLLPTGW